MSDNINFLRGKIYERLQYAPEPLNYNSTVEWTVQQQISATNGIHYVDRIGKLKDYPQYNLPVNKQSTGLMLDIGCGWGRWLVAGSKKGYVPVGIDLRLEFCQTTLNTLNHHHINGYALVADLNELPFQSGVFDLVWSFSVIQHTHKKRLLNCLENIKRILKQGGFTKLEFPNKKGLRNKYGPVKKSALKENDYNSWVVRYYTPEEYRKMFEDIFDNFEYTTHSFLGIGVLPEDLKYVSFKNKILCSTSLAFTNLTKLFSFLNQYADSIYTVGQKRVGCVNNNSLDQFLSSHTTEPGNNLNIVHLLQCPISGQKLVLSGDNKFIHTEDRQLRYPVINNIPVIVRSEAETN